jgi:hypothetical protein
VELAAVAPVSIELQNQSYRRDCEEKYHDERKQGFLFEGLFLRQI